MGIMCKQEKSASFQGAGVKHGGVSPATAISLMLPLAVSRVVILYGCSSNHLSNFNLKELDKIQSKHIKCILNCFVPKSVHYPNHYIQ